MDPKHGSKREAFIADELIEMLARHIEEHGTADDGWLFHNGANTPLPPSTVDSWWQRTVKSALIAAGCDVVTVQRALGHAKPSLTSDVYSTSGRRPRIGLGRRLRRCCATVSGRLRTPCGLRE